MERAKADDIVKVHYTGKLEDGTVFDSSADREPLEFTLGKRMVIPGFEEAAMGMIPGETKTVKVPAEEAYGPRREDMVMEVARSNMPPEIEPEVGQVLQIGQSQDQMLQVVVTEVTEESVVLDANHPLAGMDLVFDIELVEIVEPGSESASA
ncbi:FKBP-type peptidyl-prolyl cis-trans isomerase [Methanocrinis sp.]|uniref:FKBP-type peptidyl-prolyl cis-trans isomerase n=1 Tax=Methanocrinis sp. TaxID=3101522 RepID=UPI003D0C09E7